MDIFCRDVWSVEKLSLSDGLGNVRTWCKEHGELLPKNVPINIPLTLGECSNTSPGTLGADKGVAGAQSAPVIPSQGLLPPAPPSPSSSASPVKASNIRPPLANNDINKPSDILENNILVSDSLPPTSYVKMIEIWLLFSLMIPFLEVLLHTYMDSLRVREGVTIFIFMFL